MAAFVVSNFSCIFVLVESLLLLCTYRPFVLFIIVDANKCTLHLLRCAFVGKSTKSLYVREERTDRRGLQGNRMRDYVMWGRQWVIGGQTTGGGRGVCRWCWWRADRRGEEVTGRFRCVREREWIETE